MKIPQLHPMIACTNTVPQGASAFLLLGMSKKGKIYVIDEWYRESKESYSNVQAVERLIRWLEEMKEKHSNLIPVKHMGNRKHLQPERVYSRSESFRKHYRQNQKADYFIRMTIGHDDLETGIDQIMSLMQKELIKFSQENCPNLIKELKSMGWEDKEEGLPVFNCLVDGVIGLLNSRFRTRISKQISAESEIINNRQIIDQFFG